MADRRITPPRGAHLPNMAGERPRRRLARDGLPLRDGLPGGGLHRQRGEIWPRYSRDIAEMRPRFSRDAVEI